MSDVYSCFYCSFSALNIEGWVKHIAEFHFYEGEFLAQSFRKELNEIEKKEAW